MKEEYNLRWSGSHLGWPYDAKSRLVTLRECINFLDTSPLKPPTEVFLRNAQTIISLGKMPNVVMAEGVWLFYYTLAGAKLMTDGSMPSGLQDKELDQRIAEKSREMMLAGKADSEIERILTVTFKRLEERREFEESLKSLTISCVPQIWSAMECFLRDLWIVSVNACDVFIAGNLFGALDDGAYSEPISRKQISVGIVARHGLDLRGKLGSLLAGKFKFSTLDGVRAAYKAAFGKQQGFHDPLDSQQLKLLESYRNLLLHRGGLVDEKFIRDSGSNLPKDTMLEVTGDEVGKFFEAAVESSVNLVLMIDAIRRNFAEKSNRG